jgi:SAM-dependent methyltransferase
VGAEIPGDSLEYAKKSASSSIDYFEISDAASFVDLKFPFVYCFDALADAESLDDTIQTAWAALDPGGIFAYIGYAGPKNGLGTKDFDAIISLLSAIPENLLNDPRGVNESQIHSFMEEIKPRHAGGAIEAAVEARFGSQEITPLGSLFSYFLWRATLGNLSYDRDANVALILMAQAIEQRLILSRLIQPTIKLIVARKEVDI